MLPQMSANLCTESRISTTKKDNARATSPSASRHPFHSWSQHLRTPDPLRARYGPLIAGVSGDARNKTVHVSTKCAPIFAKQRRRGVSQHQGSLQQPSERLVYVMIIDDRAPVYVTFYRNNVYLSNSFSSAIDAARELSPAAAFLFSDFSPQ